MSEQAEPLQLMGIGNKSDETVTFHGLTVPAWITPVVYRRDVPYSVTLFVRIDPDTGPIPEGVQLNSSPSRGRTYKDAVALLKGEPLDDLLHQAVLMSASVALWQQRLDAIGKPTGEDLTDEERAALGASIEQERERINAVPPPVRRRIVTKQLLEEVAKVYRDALAAGTPPTQAVATYFSATHSSAARWVREARKAGILGPSRGPTAGEAPTASE